VTTHTRSWLPLAATLGIALVLVLGGLVAAPLIQRAAPRLDAEVRSAFARQDASPADWVSPELDGAIYARPLVLGTQLLIATESNSVYVLDTDSGNIRWQQHLGDPVPGSALPCGNIDPVGITSTPAIDPQAGVVYVVGLVQPTHHELYVLGLSDGTVQYHFPIDPPGADARVHNQRGALTLSQGVVYVPFGGRFGDCGDYHGRVVGVRVGDTTGGSLIAYQTPGDEAGIWAPGGAAADEAGNLFVATGNGGSTATFGYSESVLKLSPDLQVQDYFTPRNWAELNRGDVDIGSLTPALLDNDLVFQAGKEGIGYLLQASNLGQVGGEVFSARVCSRGAYGMTAYAAPYLYVPCTDGLVAVQLDFGPPAFSAAWHGPAVTGRPAAGPPLLAAGAVWGIDLGGGVLYGLDPDSGAVRFKGGLPGPARNFSTPAADVRHVYAPAGRQIAAFVIAD
jgi:PQQ-like domain